MPPVDDNGSGDDDVPDDSNLLDGVFTTLTKLLRELDNMDSDTDENRSGRIGQGNASLDYSVNISRLDAGSNSRQGRKNWRMVGESENHEYRVRMNNDDGEIVIVADLPAVSAEDVAVHTNDESRTVEITVKGETVESIPMEWNEASITKMNFENQILEVHVQPKSDNRGNANSNVADK